MIAAAQEACVSQHNGASICAVLLPSPVCEMDRTADFTDVVRKFRKVYGVSKPSSELMKPIKTTSQFTTAATTILGSIRRMYGYLVTQLDEFMANSLTIPQDAINFIRLCAVQIETLKASIEETPVSQATHKKAVVLFLRERLKVIEDIVQAQSAIRSKQLRLNQFKLASSMPAARAGAGSAGGLLPRSTTSSSPSREPSRSPEAAKLLAGLSQAELQELQMENDDLMKQLDSELEEAQAIERQMLEVSSLVSQFSEKLIDQQEEIEHLLTEVGESRSLVNKGNEQIAKATESTFTFRLFLLCFMVGASLLLLFLDWYAP